MNVYKYIERSFFLLLAICACQSCSNEEMFFADSGNEHTVVFRPVIKQDMNSRAIGDATGIDQLTVTVYEGTDNLTKRFSVTENWSDARQNGIKLTLIEGRSYKILFWAHDSDCSAYTLKDGKIYVDYKDYKNGGFSEMEELDAFYGISEKTVSEGASVNITLSRPFAQLNFADKQTKPEEGTHKSVVTFHSIPTSFNPFTEDVEMTESDNDSDDIAFTFRDFPDEDLEFGDNTYYYVSSNYLFAPLSSEISISATLDLQDMNGTSINKFEFKGDKAITLKKNMKTNVYGNIVQQPQIWSVWDGEFPSEKTLTTDPENQNCYIIDEAADIAWLSVENNSNTLEPNNTFVLTTDIDMGKKDGLSSIKLPSGSTLDGDGHSIKGLKLENALLGDVTDITVKNLKIEEATITNTSTDVETHVGVLVNTLKGSNTFSNIHIMGSSVSTQNGAAGGIVGYISRKDSNNREETLTVTFDDCHVTETTIDGTHSKGYFVGLLRGYDYNETLQFNSNCTLALSATARSADEFVSPYSEGNESAWLVDNDYSKYDGWLGNEECYRGKVFYGNNRFIPRWDGNTTIEPLLVEGTVEADHKYLVYSAFDLAGIRNKTASPTAIYLKENVDMNGQGKDGKFFTHPKFTKSAADPTYSTTDDDNHFSSFNSIAYLDGKKSNTENYGIYNLSLYTNETTDRTAFILSGGDKHVHQNVNFYNCCTIVPHIVGTDNGQTVDKSYGATVVLSVGGATYTMDNVHAYGCKVFALQKTGVLAGRIVSTTKATIKNCSVNNCYIENYKCEEHKELFKESIVSAEFYSYGEIGGITGFINYNAEITNCSVNNTTIHAYGQKDQKGNIANIIKAGTIPGRHVNQFIGDIRSKEGYTVNINNCSVLGNNYAQDSHSHSKGASITVIGEAYCLGAKIFILGQKGDKKGTVKVQNITIDGTKKFTSSTTVTLQELM